MLDRRHYPRLDAHVLWRSARLNAPQRPALDTSLGGMLVYCDDAMPLGAVLEVELLLSTEATIELRARVVRVDTLPRGSAAAFDIALEFLDIPDCARHALAERLGLQRASPIAAGPASKPRVDEQKADQVGEIEHQRGDEGPAEPCARAPIASGPDGDRHIGNQDRDQEKLIHRAALDSKAHRGPTRKASRVGRSRLHVLFVTPYLPSPPRFGGQRRLHGLIAGLAASHDVSVLSLVDPSEDHTESLRTTEAYCRHVVVVANHRYASAGAHKRLRQLGSVFSTRSYEWHIHREGMLDEALRRLLARDCYDVVQFEFPHMAASRPNHHATAAGRPAFLLDEHNIEYDIVRQTATSARGAIRRVYSAINWRKVQSEERRAWAGLDGCTLTSARDEEILLADAPQTRTAVVPNGVDLEFFKPRQRESPEALTLLFFGAIDYYPNTDGVLFFSREVLPHLEPRLPRVRLSVVGRRPPESILALRSSTVEVTGAVDDVRPHIERAAVVIVPLRLGGGTRLKILEAMAMGKAIVSTSLGAEGLEVVPERDILVADTPAAFASQIARVLDDPALAARLGASARRQVEKRYGWGASVDRLSSFYGEVIEARERA